MFETIKINNDFPISRMSAQSKLRIRKFPIEKMKDNRVILIIGKRGTGKSTLVKDISFNLRNRVDTGFAISPTFDTQMMFEDFLPKSHIFNEYSLEIIKNIISCMGSLKEQGKKRCVTVAMDDCMFDKGILKTREMREIHMNGRHLNLWFINSVQYLMDIGPDLRSQIDYVFCLKENIASNKKKLHQYFFGVFEKYEQFAMVLDKCTENHECLVLDNTQPHNNIEDSIFYYKANPEIKRFKYGKSIFYKLDHYFRRQALKRHTNQSKSQTTKLPDSIQTKNKFHHVEKE